MIAGRLSPATRSAAAQSSGRWSFGLGPRGFLLLAAGFLLLIPAWFDRRSLLALAMWDGLVLLLAGLDLRRSPSPSQLEVSRSWSGVLTLGATSSVTLEIANRGRIGIDAVLEDRPGTFLADTCPVLPLRVAAAGEASVTYAVQPTERGDATLGPLALQWRTDWGISERWAVVPLEQSVRVYPNLEQGRRESMFLVRSRQIVLEKRRVRRVASGREFESLRDYQPGDEKRDICWTAAARRSKLVTKRYQPERSQAVWILVDAGRLQRARAGMHSMLDHAVAGAFALGQVALASGDLVGLLAYGRRVQSRVAPGRGSSHVRELIEALAVVRADVVEADHATAAAEIMRVQKRRALVFWLTDVADTAGVPDVIDQATHMTTRHVVVFTAQRHPDLQTLARAKPASAPEMYRLMAAQETLERRAGLLHALRQRGALIVEASPSELGAGLVDRYLEVKERGLI